MAGFQMTPKTVAAAPAPVVTAQTAAQPVAATAGGGVFAGVGQATPSLSATYCGVGRYQSQIIKVFLKDTRKSGNMAFVEMRVCNVLDDAEGRGHRVNDDVTWCIKTNSDFFLSEVRSFVAGSIGADFDAVDEDTVTRVFSDENPLSGCFVEWTGKDVTTKTNNLFTKIKFVRNVSPTEIKESMDPALVNQMFPNGALDQLIAKANQG